AALRSYSTIACAVRELGQWFEDHRDVLFTETGSADKRDPEILKATARTLHITASLRRACFSYGFLSPQGAANLTEQMRCSAHSIAQTVMASGFNETVGRLSTGWPDGFVDGV